MKKFLVAVLVVCVSIAGYSQQYIQGSVMKDAQPNKLDILFKANYNSAAGEYVDFLQFAIAIPESVTNGHNVVATATGTGTFSNMSFTQAAQYTEGTERIMVWVFADPTVATQSWLSNTPFTGVVVNFAGG